MKNTKARYSAKWIAYTALLTALVVATTIIPPLPLGPYNVYWCDGMIFLGAYLTDPVSSFIIGGLGSALYDFGLGKADMAVTSLIIHGVQAALTSALLHFVFAKFKREPVWAIVSSVAGALVVILGYMFYYWLVAPLVTGNAKYNWEYAAIRIPRNVLQEIIGVTLAALVCYAATLKKRLLKANLLPQFEKEVPCGKGCAETATVGASELCASENNENEGENNDER